MHAVPAGLSLALLVSAPVMAQEAPQRPPQRASCFDVIPLASGAPAPALFVDRCTGATWAYIINPSAQKIRDVELPAGLETDFAPGAWMPMHFVGSLGPGGVYPPEP